MGLEASKDYAQQLLAKALASLDKIDDRVNANSPHNTDALRALADMLVNRHN